MDIKEVILKILRGDDVHESEKSEVFPYLRHIPNSRKTEEEWELYCKMCKEKGIPYRPYRESVVRPLHEKYDKYGNLLTPTL